MCVCLRAAAQVIGEKEYNLSVATRYAINNSGGYDHQWQVALQFQFEVRGDVSACAAITRCTIEYIITKLSLGLTLFIIKKPSNKKIRVSSFS